MVADSMRVYFHPPLESFSLRFLSVISAIILHLFCDFFASLASKIFAKHGKTIATYYQSFKGQGDLTKQRTPKPQNQKVFNFNFVFISLHTTLKDLCHVRFLFLMYIAFVNTANVNIRWTNLSGFELDIRMD